MRPRPLALALAMTAVVGCLPTRFGLRENAETPAVPLILGGKPKGQLIAPKRCKLTLAVVARPLKDPAVNADLWRVADEHALDPEVGRTLEANGLRLGRLSGTLPSELEALLGAKPPHEVHPVDVLVADGENTIHALRPPTPSLNLILNRGGKAVGKDYDDASGFLRLTASYDGPTGVALRLAPELHHGPVLHRYAADNATTPFSVNQFVMKDGQEEETLRDLAVALALQPGQVALVGCRPERERSLGHFLFTEPEANSDRIMQKVLVIWAARDEGTK